MDILVTLKPLYHRGEDCIGIYFENSSLINGALRKYAGARWSNSNKVWYVPLNKDSYNKLFYSLKGKAIIEQSALHQHLAAKRKTAVQPPAIIKSTTQQTSAASAVKRLPFNKAHGALIKETNYERVHAINSHVIPAMHEHLKLKAYSSSTMRTYINEMRQLLLKLGNIPADDLKPEHLKRYLVYCFEKLRLKENTLHSRINALKFYYEQVLGREKFFWEIPRPKKQLQLPRFFNQDEITSIIKAAGNIKHKTMLMLAYASGLRVSEVVSIRTKDIDSKRMCILVRQAKGKKDRMVVLSPVLLIMLREYWKTGKPTKDGYLFPGQYKDEPYSSRSLQLVLAAAKIKAGILKPGSIHALRHSFATHLLDKGTDVTMIMKLLGHNDIKTTLRYLHVSNRDMLQVMSPLDDLNLL